MAQLFYDVLGIDVSTGALATMVQESGGGLGLFLDTTREQLQDTLSVNFDETGARVADRLHWVHDASSGLLTLLDCHERRGTVAMEDLSVISKMSGIAIHDGWRPYRRYDVVHELCNAHYLRELEAVGAVFDQGWAKEMIALLLEAKHSVEATKGAGCDRLEEATLHSIRVRYGMLIQKGWTANPAPAIGKRHGIKATAANLLKRLDAQRADVLRFATDFEHPLTTTRLARCEDGQAPAEDLGLLAHTRGGPQLLRHPQLHLDNAKAGTGRTLRATAPLRRRGLAPGSRPSDLSASRLSPHEADT
jgi:transposase